MPIEKAVDPTERPKLKVLDPELPLWAAKAALEVEGLKKNIPTNFEAVNRISSFLKYSFDEKVITGAKDSYLDYGATSVLYQTLIYTSSEKEIVDVKDIIKKALTLTKQLDAGPNQSLNDVEINGIRDFFVALSKSASSYSQSIREFRPPHPFKI